MHSIFVTGTDTEVGKTQVSCALIRQLVDMGLDVVAMKPIASGARRVDGELRNDDALQLMASANVEVPYTWVNPYCFEPAIAPHIAAQQAGIDMSLDVIAAAYHQLAAVADVVVVEGVGGWYVPINSTQTVADLAVVLKLPVIMVVGMRLGCLNHAMLTVQSIQASTLPFMGWIANTLDPGMASFLQNIETLERFLPVQQLGVMPYLQHDFAHQNISFKIPFIY